MRVLAVVAALGLLAGACGAGSLDQPSTSAANAAAPPVGPTESPEPDALVGDVTPTPTSPPTPEPAPALVASVLSGATRSDWTIDPGRWAIGTHPSVVVFETGRSWTVVQQAAGFTALRDPANPASPVLIVEPSLVARPGGWAPVPSVVDEDVLGSWSELDVHRSGTVPGAQAEVGWVDFTRSGADTLGVRACELAMSRSCAVALQSDGFFVDLPIDTRVRVASVQTAPGRSPVVVVTFGDEGSVGPFADEVLAIASSIEVTGDETWDPSDQAFVATTGNRTAGLPAGRWLLTTGRTVLRLDLREAQPLWQVAFAGFRTTSFAAIGRRAAMTVASLDGLVAPGADPLEPDEFIDLSTPTFDRVDEWLRSILAVSGRAQMKIGDADAHSWDVTVDETVASAPCGSAGFDPQAECAVFMVNELSFSRNSASVARVVWIEGTDALIIVVPQEPELALGTVWDLAAPVLSSIEVVEALAG